MIPAEKAKELVNKFRDYTDGTDSETDRFSPAIEKANAIQCALIAVNEVLKVSFYADDKIYNHYLQVKQEIEKL